MWGNLKQSLATAGEGGFIAKIGDVVAPMSQNEDDEYEYESGSEEFEEEYEEEGLGDDEYEYQTEEMEQSKFSPKRVGKLFGGVLESARHFVEQQHSNMDSFEEEEEEEEEEFFIMEQKQNETETIDLNYDHSKIQNSTEENQAEESIGVGVGNEIVNDDKNINGDIASMKEEVLSSSNENGLSTSKYLTLNGTPDNESSQLFSSIDIDDHGDITNDDDENNETATNKIIVKGTSPTEKEVSLNEDKDYDQTDKNIDDLNMLDQNIQRDKSIDQMMENGNDPSAMEYLDETIGHSYNLAETGLDKTVGHHLEVSKHNEGLDQTLGHHLEVSGHGRHDINLAEIGLDQTVGHRLEMSKHNDGLDQTLGHHLEAKRNDQHDIIEDAALDESRGHHVLITSEHQEDVIVEDTALDVSRGHDIAIESEANQDGIETPRTLQASEQTINDYKAQISNLESELERAKTLISNLEASVSHIQTEHEEQLRDLKRTYEEDKDFLVNSTREAHDEEVQNAAHKVRSDMEKHILDLQKEMTTQMQESDKQLEQFRAMYEEAISRANATELSMKKDATKYSHQLAEMEKRNAITLERVEQKAARATSVLEDKDNEIKELNTMIQEMKNTIKQNFEEHEAVEDEADELHQENEELKEKIDIIEKERNQLKNDLKRLKEEHGKSLGVQIEMQLLREERDREKEKVESLKETQNSNESTLIAERDTAKATALDLEQRLATLQADFDLAKSDYERSLMANSNLQTALEAFQIERESELALLEEARISSEDAIKESNDLALQSMKQENEVAMNEVQNAANKAIQNMMSEMSLTEQKLEEYKKETVNLRRSLDEAIHRLQTNQEDVIDRSLMKNIFLDWHSKNGKSRRDVMQVVASVLHFTEDDKNKCGIGEGSSRIGKVVDAVAPPLTPAVKMPDELDGDTIREKWVNFLLAECGDSPKKDNNSESNVHGRQSRTSQNLDL